MQDNLINQKICLLGMYATGKTSLIRRFVHNLFDEKYLSTIGVNVSQKIMEPIQNTDKNWVQYNFIIWDIEGVDTDTKPIRNYYMGAHGGILVADLTRPESLQELEKLIAIFKEVNPTARLVLAGSKHDLCEKFSGCIDKEFKDFGQEHGIQTLLTSSKTGKNVNELFHLLAKELVKSNGP